MADAHDEPSEAARQSLSMRDFAASFFYGQRRITDRSQRGLVTSSRSSED